MKKLLLLFLVFLGLLSCKNSVQNRIVEAIREKCVDGGCVIRLTDFTNFEWDKMYFFTVQASNEEMSREMGIEYSGWSDMRSQIVFTFKDKIVHVEYVDYDPDKADKVIFGKENTSRCSSYAAENAGFLVERVPLKEVSYYLIPQ